MKKIFDPKVRLILQSVCGKVAYRNKKTANTANRIMIKKYGKDDNRVYFCGKCHAWHLTTESEDEYIENKKKWENIKRIGSI